MKHSARWYTAQLAATYAVIFGGLGVLMPYAAPMLRSEGLTSLQIALLMALPPGIKIITSPVIGWLADYTVGRQPLLRMFLALGVAIIPILMSASSFESWVIAIGLFALVRAPVIPLANAAVLDFLDGRTNHTPRSNFGRIRSAGSLGFVIFAATASWCSQQWGIQSIVPLLGSTMVLLLVVAWTIDQDHRPIKRLDLDSSITVQYTRRFILLLLGTMLVRIAEAGYNVFYPLHLQELGYGVQWSGILWSIAVTSEIILLFGLGSRMERWNPQWVLFGMAILNVVRWVWMGSMTHIVALVIGQIMHGATFGLLYFAAIRSLDSTQPPQLRASVQSIFDIVCFGLAGVIGNSLSGIAWAWLQTDMFFAMALTALAGSVLLYPQLTKKT